MRNALRSVGLALLAALFALAPGCSSAPALTELVLVVRADMPIGELRVSVTGPEGDLRVDEHLSSPTLPVAIVMTRDHAPYGPVTVHVEGGDVVSDTVTELVAGERRRLDVTLSSSCRCSMCAATETCRAGTCQDRHVAGAALPPWQSGADASLGEVAHDGGAPHDAGPRPDAGPPVPTCGCMHQDCCGGTCVGMLSCRAGTCLDCITTDPTITGVTTGSMRLTAVSATGDTLWVSVSNGVDIMEVPFMLAGMSATGTVPITQVVGISAAGGTLSVRGAGTTSGSLSITGATASGSFTAPMRPDGTEGWIASASGAGHVLTLTAWDGSHGTITFAGTESCR